MDEIRLYGVREHNLKGIDCRFPKGALTVVTGVSGSGKSSLVVDTLYAEGFRRYTEALSSYARRFLHKQRRPQVEAVKGMQPAVAFGQRNRSRGARSTVGTATEVVDLLRVLFARAGTLFCPDCDVECECYTPGTAAQYLCSRLPLMSRILVTARAPSKSGHDLVRDGYIRYFSKSGVKKLDPSTLPGSGMIDVIVDRIILKPGSVGRTGQAFEQAFLLGKGRARVYLENGESLHFADGRLCRACGRNFPEPEPQRFSFNSPVGACPLCHGFGRIPGIDMDRVIPDKSRSLLENAVVPFSSPAYHEYFDYLINACRKRKIPVDKPFSRLSKKAVGFVEAEVRDFFECLSKRRYRMHVRVLISRYRSFEMCPGCSGTRLKPFASWVKIEGKALPQLCEMDITSLQGYLYSLHFKGARKAVTSTLLRELRARVDYLVDVGLGYLTLERRTRTLSGGEAQRINLASSLGSDLNDTLYVLDEPSIGLHQADIERLVGILNTLKKNNNTVVVVEHEPRVIAGADHIIELGPGAGRFGGRLLYEGTPPRKTSRKTSSYSSRGTRKSSNHILVKKAVENNLRDIDVEIPLGCMTCITGVSGSGKSTLLESVLYAGLKRSRGETIAEVGAFGAIEGASLPTGVELIDQSPVARSARSNPATFMKIFTHIRTALASTGHAREQGLKAGFFSFNVPGGRCAQCEGEGRIEVDLQFLGSTFIPCSSCNGDRFSEKAMRIRYRGYNIVDILNMTVEEALRLFVDRRAVCRGLEVLKRMGLGYLRLGQPVSTLSAGESQRIKLARHLAKTKPGSLLLLDEPTTGLHSKDIDVLLDVLDRLIEAGVSLVVVEHNLKVIAHADHVIDLGPGGGVDGGRVVASGTPAEIASSPLSLTGRFLAGFFSGS